MKISYQWIIYHKKARTLLYFYIMKRLILLLGLLAVMAGACAPSRYVRPLEKGQWAAQGHFGGPLFSNLGYTIPVPLTSAGVGYGLDEEITLFADLQITELAFGVIQLNAGGNYYLSRPEGYRPGITGTLILNAAVSTWDGRAKLWPQLDVNARWAYGQNDNQIYLGLSNFFEPARHRTQGEAQPAHWLPSIFAGHVFSGKSWDLSLEGKWIAPNQSNEWSVVDYVSAAQRGSFGLYLGIAKRF